MPIKVITILAFFFASSSQPFGGQTTYFIGEGSRPSSVAVGHFNDDNQLDIAVANLGTGDLRILLGYGNRTFSNVTTDSTGTDSHLMAIAIGDFNSDSRIDIVAANSDTNDIVVFLGYGNGSFSNSISYSMGEGSQPESVAVVDFNKDNRSDIVIANSGTNNICILFSRGNGTFTNQTCYQFGYNSQPNWIIAKDLNNDGRDDIAVTTFGTDNINILFNIC